MGLFRKAAAAETMTYMPVTKQENLNLTVQR
jgi:hypothetical protein